MAQTTAERAKRLRFAMGYGGHGNSGKFAIFLGITPNRWSNIERGYPISRDLAEILRVKTGITTDWLLFGDEGGLSQQWLGRLGQLGPAARKERRRSG